MFNKILIANRGEIAVRIMRTAKKLGIQCVSVFSAVDQQALHVKIADEAYYIGKAPSRDSYLNSEVILKIARQCQAQAIHPGYGFLAENADFAQACLDNNIIFIGPPPKAIREMGSKDNAKKIMQHAKVPLVPGYLGENQEPNFLKQQAAAIGYPILLKATAGGGGKGMRVVSQEADFDDALQAAKREAKASFGDDKMMIEKYILNPRHVEIQIFADQQGNVVHLFERDCSTQRRYQKILEEAPAPDMTNELREKMTQAAITAAKAIGYVGAGTIEFLLDQNNQFYFMEMNTRLQVEHPVTEMITGLDLVAWQLQIASGERLPLTQKQIQINGHAIEARICAEDPYHQFLPATGKLHYFAEPTTLTHTRFDTGIQQRDEISSYYDPMIGKLITWGNTREQAINRLLTALQKTHIVGLKTNIPFLKTIVSHPDFVSAKLSTHFIQQHETELLQVNDEVLPQEMIIASVFCLSTQHKLNQNNTTTDVYSPWRLSNAWRLNLPYLQTITLVSNGQLYTTAIEHLANGYQIKFQDQSYHVSVRMENDHDLTCIIDNKPIKATIILHNNDLHVITAQRQLTFSFYNIESFAQQQQNIGKLTSPMPGTVIAIAAKIGQTVKVGDNLCVIEAMKMEHTIQAPHAGKVKEIFYRVGDQVAEGNELLVLE